jgi:hypothetical protein
MVILFCCANANFVDIYQRHDQIRVPASELFEEREHQRAFQWVDRVRKKIYILLKVEVMAQSQILEVKTARSSKSICTSAVFKVVFKVGHFTFYQFSPLGATCKINQNNDKAVKGQLSPDFLM